MSGLVGLVVWMDRWWVVQLETTTRPHPTPPLPTDPNLQHTDTHTSQDAMSALRGSLAAKVEATLAVLRSSSSSASISSGGSSSSSGGGIGRVTAVETAWAAEHLVQGCLLEGLQGVAAQARGLVQVCGFVLGVGCGGMDGWEDG